MRPLQLRSLAATALSTLVVAGCGWAESSSNTEDWMAAKGVQQAVRGSEQPISGLAEGETSGATPLLVASMAEAATNPQGGTSSGSQSVVLDETSPKANGDSASALGPAPPPAPAQAFAPAPAAVGKGSGDTNSNVSEGTLNSVDTMISDMSKLNDLTLKGVDLKYGFARGPGIVVLGNDPRGTNTPDWYKQSYPWMNNGTYWNFLLPWFVQFEGEGNTATNTRIQMRNMKVFIKTRSTGAWYKVNKSESVGAILCPQGSNYFHCPQSGVVRTESSGGVSSLPIGGLNLHGWWGSREGINGPDIAAVVITLQARLAVNSASAVDDRSKAKYLIQVGADYYPTDGSAETVLPSVGVSRAKLLSSDWQAFTMATMSDVGLQEPGGGISSAEMRANPPPLD